MLILLELLLGNSPPKNQIIILQTLNLTVDSFVRFMRLGEGSTEKKMPPRPPKPFTVQGPSITPMGFMTIPLCDKTLSMTF